MSANIALLKAIKDRGQKNTEFGYGVITADSYVQTLAENVGQKSLAIASTPFSDLLQKASNTLVYSNNKMSIEEAVSDEKSLSGFDFPKNTLMAFRHTLTTDRKDRDGDILRTEGALPDPNMLLLWQHVATLPIGKLVSVVDHSNTKLTVVSAIVDMNELSHDAAVMVDNKMGRFSHGFSALDFDTIKGENPDDITGFDVKRFEIMEESLVSIPSNIDAGTEEVFLSLVEGGKLTSPIMKEYGKTIREKQPLMIPGISFKTKISGDELVEEFTCGSFAELKAAADAGIIQGGKDNENESRDGDDEGEDEEGKSANASEETNEGSPEEKGTNVEEVEDAFDGVPHRTLKDILDAEFTVKQAMSLILSEGTSEERKYLMTLLQTLEEVQSKNSLAECYRVLKQS